MAHRPRGPGGRSSSPIASRVAGAIAARRGLALPELPRRRPCARATGSRRRASWTRSAWASRRTGPSSTPASPESRRSTTRARRRRLLRFAARRPGARDRHAAACPTGSAWSAILTYASPFGERTPFAGVKRLPPATAACGGVRARLRVRRSHGRGGSARPSSRSRRARRRWSRRSPMRSRRSATGPWSPCSAAAADSRIVLLAALQHARPRLDHRRSPTTRVARPRPALPRAVAEARRHPARADRADQPEEYWESWLRRTERSDFQFCSDVFIAHLTGPRRRARLSGARRPRASTCSALAEAAATMRDVRRRDRP